jgi:hypothetical protein
MSTELETRLATAFRRAGLPAAPASLVEALETVASAPVVSSRPGRGRSVWAPLAVAAVLVVAAAVVIGGGQRGVAPLPSASPSPPPAPSVEGSAVPSDGDISGHLVVGYRAQPVGDLQLMSGDMNVIATILEKRLALAGIDGVTVRVVGDDRLDVEIPALRDPEIVRATVGQTGHVDFVPLGTTSKEAGDTIDPAEFPALFSGDQVDTAAVVETQPGGPGGTPEGRSITINLKAPAAELFGQYTADHIGQYFAIAVDGKVVLAPVINSEIPGGNIQVEAGTPGGFGVEEATNLVAVLQFGPLPYPLQEISAEFVP